MLSKIKIPKNIIEFLTFSSSILIVTILNNNFEYKFNDIVYNLSLFLICAYKIIPAFQQIYYHLNIIKYHGAALEVIASDLLSAKKLKKSKDKNSDINIDFKFNFENLKLINLSFKYPGSIKKII